MMLRLAALAMVLLNGGATAAVIRAATIGCAAPADATRVVALAGRNAAQDAAAAPLIATRACLPLAKGITVDVDETKPPLSCVRLNGDLQCYWIAAALVDEHPGEKGGGGGGKHGGGGGRRR